MRYNTRQPNELPTIGNGMESTTIPAITQQIYTDVVAFRKICFTPYRNEDEMQFIKNDVM
jgi:hypothetical protein